MDKDVLIDLTGQRFGLLTVIRRDEDYISPNDRHEVQWLCQCDCENIKIVRGSSLKNNLTTSCGCRKRNMAIERLVNYNKKYNTYDLSGEYGIGFTEEGNSFYFDLEDYNKIKDGYWSYRSENDHHVTGSINGTKNSLHRFIMSYYYTIPNNMIIDHINTHHPEDNRKNNLRIATMSQNQMNRKLALNNTSGVTGVIWSSKDKRWITSIKIHGHRIVCGYFKNIDDAIKARKEAEEKYFGEYSYDNSMKKWEEINDDLPR